jgi:hypothetical protein
VQAQPTLGPFSATIEQASGTGPIVDLVGFAVVRATLLLHPGVVIAKLLARDLVVLLTSRAPAGLLRRRPGVRTLGLTGPGTVTVGTPVGLASGSQ